MNISMPVRSKVSQGATRRRRLQLISPDRRAGDTTAGQDVHERTPDNRSRRLGGPSQDTALYSCGCGYAFDAPVSTSVDCPHCGDRQAW